jgi:hypothetical protein
MATSLVERPAIEIVAAIPDKGALAESLGIRFASRRPRPGGWVPGHAFD